MSKKILFLAIGIAISTAFFVKIQPILATDTAPPVRSNGSPSGTLLMGTTQAHLFLNTDEAATCRYSTSANVPYAEMTNTFVTTGGTSHAEIITGLTNGMSYSYKVRCQDEAGNANTNDFWILFTVSSSSDVTPPIISVISVSSITANSAIINWTTNEPANSIVSYSSGTGSGLTGPLTSYTTSHSVSLHGPDTILNAGLEPSTIYTYTIQSTDQAGNRAEYTSTFQTLANSGVLITIVSPNGGETLTIGQPYNITWTTSGIVPNIRIILQDASNTFLTIADNISNTGTYSWTLSSSLQAGQYKINIWGGTDVNNPVVTDVSNNYFNIVQASTATIPEGGLIRAIGDIDVWIVKYVGAKKFKRLILSPSVFNSYGHLKWSDIKDVDQSTVNSFTTSDLVRAVNDTAVYMLYPAGDTGEKRWVTTAEAFTRMSFDWDSIYQINQVDRDSYSAGQAIE